MPDHAAFLRGINVGGRKALKEDLVGCFEAAGLRDVTTFRASGNVVFTADGRVTAADIEAALGRGLGYDVAVFLRSADEVRAIAAFDPFEPGVVEASAGKLQVSLLARKVTAAVRDKLLALSTDADRVAVDGREVYWLPSGRMQDSALEMKTFERLLGSTTMRTKGTVEGMAAKFF